MCTTAAKQSSIDGRVFQTGKVLRMRKGLLIHNLKAGSLDEELLSKLVSALGEVVSVDIEQLGEGGDALQYAEANDCDWIAVAGGDGTVESVASDLVGTKFPLGIISAGTFNNFARSLDLPLDPIEACDVILAGNARPTDVGFANGKPFSSAWALAWTPPCIPLGRRSNRVGSTG
jgi:diacylglycerol kinase family enzyme